MKRVPSRGSDQFNLRFPDGMREKIREAAEASGRSMNAEIIHRIQQTFDSDWPTDEEDEMGAIITAALEKAAIEIARKLPKHLKFDEDE